MLSHPELQHLIEAALLPRRCNCRIAPDGSINIQLFPPDSSRVELTVVGIDSSTLDSSRAIAKLVLEIDEEAKVCSATCYKMSFHA